MASSEKPSESLKQTEDRDETSPRYRTLRRLLGLPRKPTAGPGLRLRRCGKSGWKPGVPQAKGQDRQELALKKSFMVEM